MPNEAISKRYDIDAFQLADGEAGISMSELADAMQVWSLLQPGRTSVAQAAQAFNVTDKVILAAVDAHYWMFLSGPGEDPSKQLIEHEGEG